MLHSPIWPRSRGRLLPISGDREQLALAGLMLLGAIVRLRYVLVAPFPLNDGGLFYLMARELQANHFTLPMFTAYNGYSIPFAYPPVGFYVAAGLSSLTGMSVLTALRVVPALATVATLPAFYAVARTVLPDRRGALIALAVFALIPQSFVWTIMGGGLTRSLGFLVALLAIPPILRMYRYGRRNDTALAALLCAMTVLTHAEAAAFLIVSALTAFVLFGRGRRGLILSVMVGVATVALAAPWWIIVLAHHGAGPFVAAGSTSGGLSNSIFMLLSFTMTREKLFPLASALGLLGLLLCLSRRAYFLPLWLVLIVFGDPRSAARHGAVPLALLAAYAVTEGLLPLVDRLPATPARERGIAPVARLPLMAGALALYYLVFLSMNVEPRLVGVLPAGERRAMVWAAEHTPQNSSFLVVTGHDGETVRVDGLGYPDVPNWTDDRSSEWFPALSGRVSVATVQGREWLSAFESAQLAYAALQRCALRDTACLDRWSTTRGTSYTHVYLPLASTKWKDGPACCWALWHSLSDDPRFRLAYQNEDAVIFERVGGW